MTLGFTLNCCFRIPSPPRSAGALLHRGGEATNTHCERFSIRPVRLCDTQCFPPRDRTGIGWRRNLTRRQDGRAFGHLMVQKGNPGSDSDSVPRSGGAGRALLLEASSP